jgi:asparagine synthase (glutamine-hydrolysing)
VAEDQRHSLYRPEFAALLNGAHAGEAHERLLAEADLPDQLSRMLYADSMLYLPSHNLNYTDKMSMAASIEVRVPYLDNAVVDFASRLPSSLKVRGFTTKYILRKAMEGILPPEIIKRQKTGFAAPIRTWLTKDLVPLVDDVLAPSRVAARGLFSPQAVAATIEADRSGRADNSYLIWALLTLELWMVAYHVDAPSQVGAAA